MINQCAPQGAPPDDLKQLVRLEGLQVNPLPLQLLQQLCDIARIALPLVRVVGTLRLAERVLLGQ